MKFFIESSKVPIYDRIARAFTNALTAQGHTVYFGDTSAFDDASYVTAINNISIDYYISTNELNKFQTSVDEYGRFAFQRISKKAIFVHHDNLFSGIPDLDRITAKIRAYQEIAQRSTHFCLEFDNVTLLKELDIKNAHLIPHASEFTPPPENEYRFEASFVGHLMSGLSQYPLDQIAHGHHVASLAWRRISQSRTPLQPEIKSIVRALIPELDSIGVITPSKAYEQFFIATLNKLSSAFRGELISTIASTELTIIGGDLSYGTLKHPLMKLQKPNVRYISATQNYQEAETIYRQTKVNLNITSLQFDSAVNNRVIDIIMSGGLVLTDQRADIQALTDRHEDISFNTPEELSEKLARFSRDINTPPIKDLKRELVANARRKHTYPAILHNILTRLE